MRDLKKRKGYRIVNVRDEFSVEHQAYAKEDKAEIRVTNTFMEHFDKKQQQVKASEDDAELAAFFDDLIVLSAYLDDKLEFCKVENNSLPFAEYPPD